MTEKEIGSLIAYVIGIGVTGIVTFIIVKLYSTLGGERNKKKKK